MYFLYENGEINTLPHSASPNFSIFGVLSPTSGLCVRLCDMKVIFLIFFSRGLLYDGGLFPAAPVSPCLQLCRSRA